MEIIWQLKEDGQLPCTIEEKAEWVSHVDGVVSLGRDTRQSRLRVEAMKEIKDEELGDTLLAIHPVHINRIMGDIPTAALAWEDVRKAGYEVALEFLKKLPKHYDLSKEDDKKLHLLVLNAEVAAVEEKFQKGIFEITYPGKTDYTEEDKKRHTEIVEELKARLEREKTKKVDGEAEEGFEIDEDGLPTVKKEKRILN